MIQQLKLGDVLNSLSTQQWNNEKSEFVNCVQGSWLKMPGGRRGLVAPQNTFLDTLIKKAASQQSIESAGFLLANAQVSILGY